MDNEDEIDIKALTKVIFRNKLIIFLFIFLGVLYGGAKYLFGTKVWMGEFQIVLSKPSENKSTINNLSESLAGLVGLNSLSGDESMLTEVEILQSPSVLMNVFEFVKAEKDLTDDDMYLVLASDGLWDVMTNEDCATFILSRSRNFKDVARALCYEAMLLGSADNVTVLVIDLKTDHRISVESMNNTNSS